jgi:hypothetical protein
LIDRKVSEHGLLSKRRQISGGEKKKLSSKKQLLVRAGLSCRRRDLGSTPATDTAASLKAGILE